jgi:hypothetical protein
MVGKMIIQQKPRFYGALGALGVLVAGFGALLVFWLSADWPTENGLFHYLSATLGDGLLLPLMVAILIGGIASLPATHDDRLRGCAGFAIGTLAGMATQAAWLADDSPSLNWTLPAPHQFNAPGWYHAVFLSLVSGLLLGLAVVAATRVRAARGDDAERVDRILTSPWLGTLFAASVTMVGLLIADNRDAVGTDAGMATAAGVGFSALVASGLLAWTFGRRLRAAVAGLAFGLGAACGATALATWGLAAPQAIASTTVASAAVLSLGLSDLRPGRLRHLARAIPVCLVLLGGAAVSFQLVGERGFEAAVAIAVAALAAVSMSAMRQQRVADEAVVGITVFYVLGVLALAAWLAGRPADNTEAAVAVAASLTVLDAIVITLVRDRYRGFMLDVQAMRQAGLEPPPPGARGDAIGTWALVAGLSLPVLAALGVLAAEAAPSLGADDVAGGRPPSLMAWLIGGLALVVLTGAAARLAVRRRKPPQRFDVDTRASVSAVAATACLLVSAATVTLALTQLHAPLHYPLAAAVAAVAVAVLVGEDLVRSSLLLQLARATPAAWAIAAAGGAMVAAGLFWLLTTGLWHGEEPASVGGALEACAVTLLPLGLCAGGFGVVISSGLRTRHLTEQPPSLNTFWQQIMYAVLVFAAVAIPFFVVGRVDAHGDLANSGLVTLATLSFMPALLGVVLWVLGKNAEHAKVESRYPLPDRVKEHLAAGAPAVEEINDRRKAQLRRHVNFVNGLVGVILGASTLWIAVHAL